jgi:bisphosphoglycerate-independent phosphoglycerate mutase (AlkP superfamily)
MTRLGKPMPRLDAAGAARVLVGLVERHDFVLYEYFLTDLVAHRGSTEQKLEQARRVEALVDAVLRRIDLGRHHVVMTSDHGNLEEGEHPRHTLNPVPLLAWGPRTTRLLERAVDLTGVAPGILDCIGAAAGKSSPSRPAIR